MLDHFIRLTEPRWLLPEPLTILVLTNILKKLIPLFVTNLIDNKKVPLYGDGMNVRDWIYVADNCTAIDLVLHRGKIGEIYNIGGGVEKSVSIWSEFSLILKNALNKELKYSFKDWRPGDQKIYVSDTRKIKNQLGWKPIVSVEKGVSKLANWVSENPNLFL